MLRETIYKEVTNFYIRMTDPDNYLIQMKDLDSFLIKPLPRMRLMKMQSPKMKKGFMLNKIICIKYLTLINIFDMSCRLIGSWTMDDFRLKNRRVAKYY